MVGIMFHNDRIIRFMTGIDHISRDTIWYMSCIIITLRWNSAQPARTRYPIWYASMVSIISIHDMYDDSVGSHMVSVIFQDYAFYDRDRSHMVSNHLPFGLW